MKTSYLAGAAGLALFLAACGGGETPAPTTETPPPVEEAETEAAAPEETVEVAETEAPAEEVAAEDAPVEEAALEEAPTEEAPAEEAPAEAEAADASDDGAVVVAGFTGDAANGQRVFTQCRTCHQVQPGRNMVGPSLYGILGREAGSVEGFRYSDANANSGIVWTEEVMYEYLENPARYIPGTIMAFPGLRREQDRVDVIAYLKSIPNS